LRALEAIADKADILPDGFGATATPFLGAPDPAVFSPFVLKHFVIQTKDN
jgi:hypothetical protein